MGEFDGKVALVTGSSKGIGKGVGIELAKNGADVVINYCFDKNGAIDTKNQIESLGKKAIIVEADVGKFKDVKNMFNLIYEEFGRIDILTNFAGILEVSPFIKIKEEEWDNIMAVNVKGTFLVCREVAKQMIKRKSGKIINTSSIAAKKAIALHAHYCASKFAIVGLTQTLAIELAPYNINVNCVCPGDVDTDMFKKSQRGIAKEKSISYEECRKISLSKSLFNRFEQPEDVAPLVVFLASDDANFMTGQAINVAGGIQFN